jgi:PKD repeat protein
MPVQLAIPNTFGIETGKEVFFMRKVQLPSDDGTLKTAWFIEESGIVGTDGLIRTSSPPWKGVELLAQKDNEYTIVVPKFSYRVVNAQIPADWITGVGIAGIALVVGGAYIAATSPLIGGAAIAGGLGLLLTPFIFQDKFESSTEIIDTPDIVRFPVAGFPYPPTSTGVSLNLAQLSSQSGTPIAQVARPTGAFKASNTPTIDTLEVDFDLEGAFIRVSGQNLVSVPVNNQQNQENQQSTDKLVFDLQYAGKIYRQSKVEVKESNNGKQVFTFQLPNHIPVSEDLRVTAVRQVLNPPIGSPLEVVSQTVAPIFKHFDRVVATNPLSGNVKIMNALNAATVVADSGSQNLLLASLSLGQYTRPRYSAALDDRIYVPLEGAKSVAVLDALGLRELDTNPDTEQIDRIKLPDGSTPSAIVFSPDKYYAYIADRNLGSIYVLDVNPNSPQYNEHIGTISVSDSNGIQQLSINSDGTLLFATNPSTKSGKGAISILNINPSDRAQQARGNVKKYNRVIQTVNTEPGVTGLSATENSNVMFFTNRYREAQGFGRITLDRAPDGIISSHNIDYAQMQLGSIYDYFDVNEAYAVTMLRDQKTGIEYAFVAGRNGRQFGSGIESIDGQGAGSNVGIVRIAPGQAPELVAATRPIPMGLTSSLTLSDDNSYLYVANPGVNATFVYDVRQIIKTVETAKQKDLQSKPLDDINPLVGIPTNIGQGGSDKNRPIGAGASWGTTSHAKDVQIIAVQPDINSIPDVDQPLRVIKFKFALNPQFNPQSENTNASTNSILDAIAEALIPPANAFQERIPQSGRPSSGTVRRNVPGGTPLPPTGKGISSFQSLDVTVNNAAPIVDAGNDVTIDEGQAIAFNATYNDPGILDTHTINWDFGDGSTTNATLTPTHIYANNGTYTAKLTVTDKDGGITSDTLTVTVSNIAPTIDTINGDITVNEGSVANFTATATDPGNDILTYTWNFGDGTDPIEGQTVNHIFADNGNYIVTLTVRDSDGAATVQTLNTKVSNVAPIVNAGTDSTANEGQAITFNGTYTDPGILDTHTITWDFGDGNTTNGILNPTHTYSDNGTYNVTMTVTDNAGASTTDTLTITVNNVAPTITQLTGTTEVAEGTPANFTATATDPGNDTLTYTWNFGDGSNPIKGKDVTHTFLDNGIYTVSLTVRDKDGASTTQTLSTKVNNVAATVNAGTDQTMYQNEPVIFDGQFTDPGILDTHTIKWNFGDGTILEGGMGRWGDGGNSSSNSPTPPLFPSPHPLLNPNHTYVQNGEYTVTLTITDNDGAVSNDTMTVTVKKPPTMSVGNISILEGDNGNKYAVFTASLSEASLRNVTANYSTSDGTANKGSDYTATNGTISFGPGEISKTITVQILGDTLDEFDETFGINFTNATNATILNNQAIATILNDDAAPTLTISDRTITEGDNGTATVTYTVNLSAPSGKPISVKYATADGTATAGTDYTTANGIVSFAPGETSKTITVQVLGDTIDEFDETFGLYLTNPENATIAKNQAVTTILDDDAAPTLTIGDKTITEGDNGTFNVTYTINLNTPSGKPVTVNYTTADGTATAGTDYTATNGLVTFAPGETSKTITVQVLGDTIDEFDETFGLYLTNPENATITKNQAVTTILDNDAAPTLTIGDRTITEGENGMMAVTYTINLNTPSGKPVTVNYTTADGTATAGTDYTTANGIVSFAPGEISKTITVQVLGDTIDEFDETFGLNLSNPENATITKNQAVTTILDNDAAPTLTIGDKTITEGDNGMMAVTYTINLNTPSGKPISVKYATADGTATAGTDYTATNGIVTFAPGETSKTITVQVLGDTIDEFDETFGLYLTNPENATIAKNQALSTIIDNDAAPILTINDRTITEGDNGMMAVTYTINLNAASGKPITVDYSTADGTATAGLDYIANNGKITFAPGETTKTITVQVLGDALDEFDENFFLNLTNPENATIIKNQAVTTILDNDAPPVMIIGDKTITEVITVRKYSTLPSASILLPLKQSASNMLLPTVRRLVVAIIPQPTVFSTLLPGKLRKLYRYK